LPTGFQAGAIDWPRPERFPSGPLVSYGYKGDVWLPVAIHPPASLPVGAMPVKLTADVEWLVCRDICIVQERQLTLALPVISGQPSPSAADAGFTRARQQLPRETDWPARFHIEGEELVLRIVTPLAETGRPTWFFPLSPGAIDNAAPQSLTQDGGAIVLRVRRDMTEARLPETVSGVLVAARDGAAVAYTIHARQETVPPQPKEVPR
jgi:thiol:disulfide interchange protein DsbD